MTERKLIIMDYDDLNRLMDEVADKVAARVQEIRPPKDDKKALLTPKEVAARFGVTPKTLFVWHRTGFLPRYRIGGVVRYKIEDVEKVEQTRCK